MRQRGRKSLIFSRICIYKAQICSFRFQALLGEHIHHVLKLLFARPLLAICLFGILGGLLGHSFSFGMSIISFALTCLMLAFVSVRTSEDRAETVNRLVIIALSFVFGAYAMGIIAYQQFCANRFLLSCEETESLSEYNQSTYSGFVISYPSAGRKYQTCAVRLTNGIIVNICTAQEMQYGMHVRIYGELTEIPHARNPGGFDYHDYYARKGIYLQIDAYDSNICIIYDQAISEGLYSWLFQSGERMREITADLWRSVLPNEEASLLDGMILGDTDDMSEESVRQLRMCNLSHLTAVSGSNIGYFLIPITAFLQIYGGKRFFRYVIIISFLIYFGFLTGWASSVTRALFMALAGIVSAVISKRHDMLSGLYLSGVLLIFHNPYVSVDLGFLLSFFSTLSMILFSKRISTALTKILRFRTVSEAVAGFISAQLGMLPFLCIMSGKQSILLFIVNIIGSFLAEGISVLSIPLTGFLMLSIPFPFLYWPCKLGFLPLSGLLWCLQELAVVFSTEAISGLRLCEIHPVLLIGIVITSVSVLLPKSFLRKGMLRVSMILVLISLFFQSYSFMHRPAITIVFADVGQGDCALIILRDNTSILIDGGDEGEGEDVLIPMLDYYGIVCPDITILTHLHKDHGSGIIELIKAGRIHDIYTPCTTAPESNELSELFVLADRQEVTLHEIRKGDEFDAPNHISISVLSPDVLIENGGNDDSAIILLGYNDIYTLFMGDAGEEIENDLACEFPGKIDLKNLALFLKVGHHGSRYASTELFLQQIMPDAAIISVGNNNYGHPTSETLERLADASADVFRTDQSGAIILEIYADYSEIHGFVCA